MTEERLTPRRVHAAYSALRGLVDACQQVRWALVGMPARPGVLYLSIYTGPKKEGLSEYEVGRLISFFRLQHVLRDRVRELVDPALLEAAASQHTSGVVMVGAVTGASYADLARRVAESECTVAPPADQLHVLTATSRLLAAVCQGLRTEPFDPTHGDDRVPQALRHFGTLMTALDQERDRLLELLIQSDEGVPEERPPAQRTARVPEQIGFHARVYGVVGELIKRHNRPPKTSEIIALLGVPKSSFYRKLKEHPELQDFIDKAKSAASGSVPRGFRSSEGQTEAIMDEADDSA